MNTTNLTHPEMVLCTAQSYLLEEYDRGELQKKIALLVKIFGFLSHDMQESPKLVCRNWYFVTKEVFDLKRNRISLLIENVLGVKSCGIEISRQTLFSDRDELKQGNRSIEEDQPDPALESIGHHAFKEKPYEYFLIFELEDI